jgi:hypothetical protein
MREKALTYTRHVKVAIQERELNPDWIERTVRSPDWVAPDTTTVGAVRHFKAIPEYRDRILRVACLETPSEIRILTAFFDRKAKRPL